ncbi:glycosyltransferase [Shewanella sp. UCD-KL12]|uniref:glycosyltransferase n=1 Tax=Shewanella sp. UCD-KL12 TaxID=1917163 RepID=UPI0009707EB1|nr:glycosyltransferase [Shewanella sp. UCD-KL12]
MNTVTTQPLVSVYMPTKNRKELLEVAINSVFSQDYPNIELVIVDDGSSDGTQAWLEKLAQQHQNVKVFRFEESLGACAARNWAITHASGEFVTGLDDDDLFLPNRISSLVNGYSDDYAFICSSCIWDFGKRQRIIDSIDCTINLEQQLSYNEATNQILVKRERVLAIGGFDTSFVSCQDYDLWTRLIIEYGEARRINIPSYIINDNGSSERMIHSSNGTVGYTQFNNKHKHLMTKANLANQRFMQIRRLRKPLTILEVLKQLGSGHMKSKLRYFLSSNFKFVRRLHQKIYRKN